MLRVLVTDDEPIFLKRLKDILRKANAPLEIFEALSGKEALEMLATNKYDAMALDIDMPGMNGLTVLKKVKEQYPKLPVLMFSFPKMTNASLKR
jgi:CheY-like chemotaxis protein